MISFTKWLEFADAGGIVSYDHMNNQVSNDGFNKINSKWMSRSAPGEGSKFDVDVIFRKKKRKKHDKF